MIPLALIQSIVALLLEMLKAWNALPELQRTTIVDRWLKDDEKRRKDWATFTGWFGGLWAKVKIT